MCHQILSTNIQRNVRELLRRINILIGLNLLSQIGIYVNDGNIVMWLCGIEVLQTAKKKDIILTSCKQRWQILRIFRVVVHV